MPDKDGYPTEEELEKIRIWDIRQPVSDLITFLESLWWMPTWGFLQNSKRYKLILHTGGWSGNEDIIAALEQSMFWCMYWQVSKRGGHYYFDGWQLDKRGKRE